MKILIAEDDITSRMILKAMLTKWDYEVVETCNGDEAWEALQKEDAPRLAILDWVMPGMSGEKICQKLRETRALIPTYIILLTSKREKEDVVEGLEAGANDYIRKPFDRPELRARVRVGERVLELEAALAERIHALQDALSHVKTLQGLLPICMHCHKIRNDQQNWEQLEIYISEHTDAEFSHGLCPECMKKHYDISLRESSQGGT
ncbi:MAG: response regulator receiver protein [Deltaproteobacteria bacterium RBG_13_53_10]|nr:MAG: response regulator receiver protein [Deltaproteobacteria bacterium RBG_13_53_10]